MDMNKFYEKLDEIADMKDGWGNLRIGKAFSKLLIERCGRMAEQMDVVPDVRPTIEDSICFGYDDAGVGVEIAVYDDKIEGFVSGSDDNCSVFVFDTEEGAVNFWNTFVGVLSNKP